MVAADHPAIGIIVVHEPLGAHIIALLVDIVLKLFESWFSEGLFCFFRFGFGKWSGRYFRDRKERNIRKIGASWLPGDILDVSMRMMLPSKTTWKVLVGHSLETFGRFQIFPLDKIRIRLCSETHLAEMWKMQSSLTASEK